MFYINKKHYLLKILSNNIPAATFTLNESTVSFLFNDFINNDELQQFYIIWINTVIVLDNPFPSFPNTNIHGDSG